MWSFSGRSGSTSDIRWRWGDDLNASTGRFVMIKPSFGVFHIIPKGLQQPGIPSTHKLPAEGPKKTFYSEFSFQLDVAFSGPFGCHYFILHM